MRTIRWDPGRKVEITRYWLPTYQISAPGHNSVVEAPDGDLYIIYHRHADASCQKPNWDRVVCMDRLFFDEEGKLHTDGPSAMPRQVYW